MSEITTEGLQNHLRDNSEIENFELEADITIDGEYLKHRHQKISNCTFENLTITHIDSIKNLQLNSCKVNGELELKNIKCDCTIELNNCTIQSVSVLNTKISGLLVQNESSIAEKIDIHSSKFEVLSVHYSELKEIEISKCEHIELLDFRKVNCEFFSLNDCSEIIELKIYQLYSRFQFSIVKCNVIKRFNCQISAFDSINIENCTFACDFSWKTNPIRLVSFVQNTFEKEFHVVLNYNKRELKDIGAIRSKTIEDFSLNNNILNHESFVSLSGNELINFYNKFNGKSDTKFSCYLPKTHSAYFTGEINNCTYVFNFFILNEFTITDLYNYAHLNLSKLNHNIPIIEGREQPKRKLAVNNTFLGNTHINNCDLSTFDDIVIEDSQLQEISTSNVKWFEKLTVEKRDVLGSVEYRNYREVYRQLKIAMERQGDKVKYLDFKAKELSAYKDLVKGDDNVAWYEKLILWVGKWTNDFGQDWSKAAILLLTLNFVALLLLNLAIAKSLNPVDLNFHFSINAKHYFTLLNPTHRLNDIISVPFQNVWINFIDYFSRLINSLLIFQIISAFRKYFK